MHNKNQRPLWITIAGASMLSLAALSGCGGGSNSGGIQSPTPAPTAAPVVKTVTVISTSGRLDAATGRFTQTRGSFDSFTGAILPGPDPTPEPTIAPEPGATGALYTGTYTLNSGESGEFTLFVAADGAADGLATPPDFFRFQMNPVSSGSGNATVTVQISGSTGSGTIVLSNGTRGSITITGKTTTNSRIAALRQRMTQSKATRARLLQAASVGKR